MEQKLDRTLGLFSSLTISVGTMIGSAIFVLAGTSFEIAGPSATLSIFLAGLAAVFTGFSFAELVTIIPKAGGGYAYVREATNNNVVAFISGWGFWLAYALSCALFAIGFGNFIHYFFPFIPPLVSAYLLVIYVVFTNIRGLQNSSKLQNIITIGLIILLVSYIVYGSFHMDLDLNRPFFPNGFEGMFSAMGILYMTYIGYGLITTASEEVINPEKTIPKAIIISLIIVIILKTATFLIGASLIPWDQLIPNVTNTPMIDTAVKIAGGIGGYLFALAGILATLSSINTAIMASSRTSFALSRDLKMPSALKYIHPKTKTPIFSILLTGIIVVTAISLRDLKHISTVTSVFSLTGYTLVNVAVIIFRKRLPKEKRHFKVPLYPFTTILGILINIFLIVQLLFSDYIALIITLVITIVGLLYNFKGLPILEKAPKGLSNLDIPKINQKMIDKTTRKKILVPLANSQTMDSLIKMSFILSSNTEKEEVIPIHVVKVPDVIALESSYVELKDHITKYDHILEKIKQLETSQIPLQSQIVLSKDIPHAIVNYVEEYHIDFLLMGWHPHDFLSKIKNGIMHKVLNQAKVSVGILKSHEIKKIKRILFPYGGGKYSQYTIDIVRRIAEETGAEVTVLHVIKGDNINHINSQIISSLEDVIKSMPSESRIEVASGEFVDVVIKYSNHYDLLVISSAIEWGANDDITGVKSDIIMEKTNCSALLIRPYSPVLYRNKLRNRIGFIKKRLE